MTLLLLACHRDDGAPSSDASLDAAPPWDVAQPEPEPRPGMVWIPSGVLIAGTPPERLPRVADEEMPGEQVVLRGFYIDTYPYPNEIGAIPRTDLTFSEARDLCEQQNKRLCTELEWERACKGPQNTAYEYGEAYKASTCSTGTERALVPNGMNTACQSAFGVHDLHGGIWTWTASTWRRDPSKTGLFAIRGGNGRVGELVGRCANGRGVKPDVRRPDLGMRCCAGEANTFEVEFTVSRGEALEWQPPDQRAVPQLEALLPDDVRARVSGLRKEAQYKVERMWKWHPLGNEELVIGGGCAHAPDHGVCGVVIARVRFDKAALLAFVPTDWWQPTVGETETPREFFLYGGDHEGAFRKRVAYEWGRIGVKDKERKKKRKGRREPSYD
jgi:hypothetical protein